MVRLFSSAAAAGSEIRFAFGDLLVENLRATGNT
jgi:hypothetical protein